MVPAIRKAFNQQFTKDTYQAYLKELDNKHPGALEFRVAETPIFIDKKFKHKILEACFDPRWGNDYLLELVTVFAE